MVKRTYHDTVKMIEKFVSEIKIDSDKSISDFPYDMPTIMDVFVYLKNGAVLHFKLEDIYEV